MQSLYSIVRLGAAVWLVLWLAGCGVLSEKTMKAQKDEDDWFCKFYNSCGKEKSPECSIWGNCGSKQGNIWGPAAGSGQ